MTGYELMLCFIAVLSSSTAQLCLKAGAIAESRQDRSLTFQAAAIGLMGASVLLVTLVLRTLPLSQLIIFAAGAYILVPIGSHFIFGDKLTTRFWVGTCLISAGVAISYG